MKILSGVSRVSCRTVRIDRPSGQSWVAKQALPQLRVEALWISEPERIHREALAMELVARVAPPGSMPALVFEMGGPVPCR